MERPGHPAAAAGQAPPVRPAGRRAAHPRAAGHWGTSRRRVGHAHSAWLARRRRQAIIPPPPARTTTTTTPTTTGSGEPDDDFVRADAGSTATIFGEAVAPPLWWDEPPLPPSDPPAFPVGDALAPFPPGVVVVVDPFVPLVVVVDPEPLVPLDGVALVVDVDELPPVPPVPEVPPPFPDPDDCPPSVEEVVPAPPVPDVSDGAIVVVVTGAAVVVVVPPAREEPAARTCVGVNVGFPVPAVPVTVVPPNTQAVTLPGVGLYVTAPSWL